MIIIKDLCNAVDKNKQLVLDAERFIWQHPETGFKEKITSKYMEDAFIKLGYNITRAEGITGFYTNIDTGRKGPKILILGELDAIICPSHKESDPVTGAVHSCGHNAQCAALLGIASALKEPGILDKFCGQIMLCAVPAEELLEIEYRTKLKSDGIIKYLGGKTEFLHRGYFDDVDIAFMVHTSLSFRTTKGSVGCIAKKISYTGLSSHAGGSPWNGKNALYAATCGINAANALRETFKESDVIRFHPIITHGGEIVNAIPELVQIESYVRGSSYEAIANANKKINQALCGAALSLNTNIIIDDTSGYAPLINDKNMLKLAEDALKLALPETEFSYIDDIGSGSTDMGDLSCIMPVIHPYAGGSTGNSHGNNYEIKDPESACIGSAKWQLGMLLLLLENNAERAYKVINEFKPMFKSKKEFLDYIDSINSKGERIIYQEGKAEVII